MRIQRANLDGSEVEDVVTVVDFGLLLPYALALDLTRGKIYWIGDWSGWKIQRANLDGSQVETIAEFSGGEFSGKISVDPINAKVYWTHGGNIQRANLDGTEIEDVVVGAGARGIVVDPLADRLYWASRQSQGLGIIRGSTLAGENSYDIVFPPTQIRPDGITVDSASGRLYWTDASADEIARVFVDGMEFERILANPLKTPVAIALDSTSGRMYWTDAGLNAIHRAGLDGFAIERLYTTDTHILGAITLDVASSKMYWLESHSIVPQSGRLRQANLDGSDVVDVATGLGSPVGLAFNPVRHIRSSSPTSGSIDVRQPHDPNDTEPALGWSSVDLFFSGGLSEADPIDFEISQVGGQGVAPGIDSIVTVGPDALRVTMDDSIAPGAWTCIHHVNSGTQSCLGYLPADVNGDGVSVPTDVLSLIDSLNGIVSPPYELWQTDIDRSGDAGPADILRLIDLLNGAGAFEPWLGRNLPLR